MEWALVWMDMIYTKSLEDTKLSTATMYVSKFIYISKAMVTKWCSQTGDFDKTSKGIMFKLDFYFTLFLQSPTLELLAATISSSVVFNREK